MNAHRWSVMTTRTACLRLAKLYVNIKWLLFGFYYNRLIVQARHLYHQSTLFKLRWQEMGLDFAEESFQYDIEHFFYLAGREPFIIRCRLFLDGLVGAELRAYYIE